MTYEQLNLPIFHEQDCGPMGSHAREFQSLEKEKGLGKVQRIPKQMNGAIFSTKLLDFCKDLPKKLDPNGCSVKTLKIFCLLTEDMDSPEYSVAWTKQGTTRNGNSLIQSIATSQTGGVIRGIPQNRERVYIISHLRRKGRREVFPIPRADGENIAQLQDMTKGQPQFHRVYKAEGCAPNLETSITKIGRIAVENIPSEPEVKQIGRGMSKDGTPIQGYGVYDMNGVSPTLTTGWGSAQPYVIDEKQMSVRPILTPDREEKRQNGRRMKNEGEPMFTLTAQDRHGVAIGGCYTNGNQAYNRPIMKDTARAIVAQGSSGVVIDETDTDNNAENPWEKS